MKHLRPLITSGEIKTFEQLLSHTTIKEVAKAMGCGPVQVKAITRDHSVMTLGQLYGLSEALGLGWRKVSELFVE